MAGSSSQGTTFSFGGSAYTITSVTVDFGQERDRVSGPHMGMAADAIETVYYIHRTVDSLPTVSVEFIGSSAPAVNASGNLAVGGRISYSGAATCISSQVSAQLDDIVRGSASFRVRV
jgi:hypothetical protein